MEEFGQLDDRPLSSTEKVKAMLLRLGDKGTKPPGGRQNGVCGYMCFAEKAYFWVFPDALVPGEHLEDLDPVVTVATFGEAPGLAGVGLSRGLSDKASSCQCRRSRRYGFDRWVGKEMATHSSIFPLQEIPWTEEPGR